MEADLGNPLGEGRLGKGAVGRQIGVRIGVVAQCSEPNLEVEHPLIIGRRVHGQVQCLFRQRHG